MTAAIRPGAERRSSPPWDRQRVIRLVIILGTLAGGIYLLRYLEFAPVELFNGLFRRDGYVSRAFPPTFTSTNSVGADPKSEFGTAATAILRTLIMAWAGTGLACIFAFPVGLGAARNITPHRHVATACRALISFCRATPEIVFATVFVLIASIGEKAGVLALAVHSIGMLGKVLSDRIEEIDDKPVEAAFAAGVTRIQMIYNAVLPQVVPSWINNVVYRFDINLRASAILGFVGAGGIGVLLQSDLKNATRYPIGMAIALSLAAVIFLVEVFSGKLRNHLKGVESKLSLETRDRGVLVAERTPANRTLTPPWSRERLVSSGTVTAGIILWMICMLEVGLFGIRTLRPLGLPLPLPQFLAIPIKGLSEFSQYWPDWNTVGYLVKGETMMGQGAWLHAWRDTLTIAGGAAFMAVILAIPAAFLAAKSTSPNRHVAYVLFPISRWSSSLSRRWACRHHFRQRLLWRSGPLPSSPS
jgi:phosphonate ABC transporter permease subunit PhnE